ncbi:DUF3379 domain-containing protein [Shewanella gelidii]|uniref:DUF3379 domain-containing protein n=1 Tax=Shewanella gelidii TaxID=1642821 RepID=A0A917JRH2_9GAMM|nr:DUF3379 domain-containing protein [Shewanella gelidii]MCL1098215.1 DUF3379 domain-containing protein [Shewanella gelidii]GGI83459.1 hypothetical protein GCM10009332_20940 [Shewanella gelidii]
MDELKFRRHAYGEPQSQDPEFLAAINEDSSREEFVNDLKFLDAKLEQALKVDVPDDLSDKLILRQQLTHHHSQRKKTGFMVAMAASVAFVAGISFSLLRLAPVDLGDHALAHVYHEDEAMTADQNVSFKDVNVQLASLKGLENSRFTQQPGEVFYTTYCDFQGVKSIHLVMEGQQGKVTLFVVPAEKRFMLEESFADENYKGMGFEANDAYMLAVAEQEEDLEYVKKEIINTFI